MRDGLRIQRSRTIITGPTCLYVTLELSTSPVPCITVGASYCGEKPDFLKAAVNENDVRDGFRKGVARANAEYGTAYHPAHISYNTDMRRVARWVEHLAYEIVEADGFQLLSDSLHQAVKSAKRNISFQKLANATGVSKPLLGRLATSSCVDEIDTETLRTLLDYFELRRQSSGVKNS